MQEGRRGQPRCRQRPGMVRAPGGANYAARHGPPAAAAPEGAEGKGKASATGLLPVPEEVIARTVSHDKPLFVKKLSCSHTTG